ncbi:unnamed protein product, partial [Choristocarpus tenellus]
VASFHGRDSVVRVLLAHGAAVDGRNRTQNTPLHLACQRGKDAVVETLLEAGADAG